MTCLMRDVGGWVRPGDGVRGGRSLFRLSDGARLTAVRLLTMVLSASIRYRHACGMTADASLGRSRLLEW